MDPSAEQITHDNKIINEWHWERNKCLYEELLEAVEHERTLEGSMPGAKSKKKTLSVDPDYVRMYYEHQYDRINKHEDRAINVSSIVLTVSALVITFGLENRQSFGSIFVFFLPFILIVINFFAILYVQASGKWIKSHRERAKLMLDKYVHKIHSIDKRTMAAPTKFGRRTFQYVLHGMFVLIAIILIILFALEYFG